ncbi:hypothetical protein [Halomonas halocynthiae]|nr:hypothetical protein [Halomonas halocynthiae]
MSWLEFLAAIGAGAVLTLVVEVAFFFWATGGMDENGEGGQ